MTNLRAMRTLSVSFVGAVVVAAAGHVFATSPQGVAGANLQIGKHTTLSQIRALPDSAPVRTPGGRVTTAGRFKALADAIVRIRQKGAGTQPNPAFALSRTRGPAQLVLAPGADLREVAKRPESDVIGLPDGRTITVGDLKKLSAFQQRRTGRALLDAPSVARRQARTGPATRIDSTDDLARLAGRPDSLLLETRTGKRLTLGELRAYARANGTKLGVRK